MSFPKKRDSALSRWTGFRQQVLDDTQGVINRQLRNRHTRCNDWNETKCGREDPRNSSSKLHRSIRPGAESTPVVLPGVVIDVPTNEQGQLGSELFVPLISHLSRLAATPWGGDVLLDFSGVVSMTPEFAPVFKWFRSKLERQRRSVMIYVDGKTIAERTDVETDLLLRFNVTAT